MASHHQPGNAVPLEELLAVVRAARILQMRLDADMAGYPNEREALRTALTNLDRK